MRAFIPISFIPLFLVLFFGVGQLPNGAAAQESTVRNGSDLFVSGDTVLNSIDHNGDVFAAAEAAVVAGTSLGDLHVTGFDVSVGTDVAEDLYAAGANVTLRSNVGGDSSAFAFTLHTTPDARTTGNARLAGNTVTIEGPVEGALMVAGRTVILNAPITGDVRVTANSLTFGENAKVDGVLSYSTPEQVAVPERVAAPDRVQYSKLDFDGTWGDVRKVIPVSDLPGLPTAFSVFGAFLVSLLFFMLLGALALGFMPKRLERMRAGIARAPARSVSLGAIGLSLLFGLVPIAGMTIIGLPFIPINLLAIVVVWTLGYALGSYTIAMALWNAFGGAPEPGIVTRILLLAAAVTLVALLNFVPFLGWVVNFTLVLLGIGAITQAVFAWFITDIDPALDVDMNPASD